MSDTAQAVAMPHPFYFNYAKAIQAVGVLLRATRARRMNYMRLLKLLYLAERESLKDTGRPITGDRVVALQRGPVPSGVYDLVRGQHVEVPRWNRFFRRDGYELQLVQDPDVGELSPYEIEKLEEISRRYEDRDEWEMVQVTHELPEWARNNPGQGHRPIPVEHILEAVGRGQDIEAILKEEQDRAVFDRLFNRPPGPPVQPSEGQTAG